MTSATTTVHDLGNGHKCYIWGRCSVHNKTSTKAELAEAWNKRIDALNDPNTAVVPEIQKQSPENIDDVLANLYYQQSRMLGDINKVQAEIERYQRYLDGGRMEHQANDFRRWIADGEAKIADIRQQMRDIQAEMKPGEDEFRRRGGWTRAFLVTNGNGHVHSSMSCSTCRPSTTYNWLTQYSGKNEAQIVEDAGHRACTVCYASAPVETFSRPSKIEDPEKKAKREAREKAKAIRDAKAAEVGITNPDGTPLMFKSWSGSRGGQEIKNYKTAEREAIDILYNRKYTERYAQPGSVSAQPAEREFHEGQLTILVNALAHKHGQTPAEVRASIEERAQKKFNKDYR